MPNDWTARVWREYRADNLTRAYRDVLLTLATFRGRGGSCWPSHATLAARARCSTSTVLRALKHARLLGLIEWAERRVRAAWRWLRTSNSYQLLIPDGQVQPGSQPIWWRRSTNSQSATGGEGEIIEEATGSKKTALAAMLAGAAVLPDLLRARRTALMAAWTA